MKYHAWIAILLAIVTIWVLGYVGNYPSFINLFLAGFCVGAVSVMIACEILIRIVKR